MSSGSSPEIRRFTCVDSALSELARAAREDTAMPDFTSVLAEHQNAGRGRSGREWLDDSGSSLLLATLIRVNDADLPWATLLAGLAVCDTLEARGLTPGLKWPNDVLLEGRKVCGILCEHIDTIAAHHRVGVGIGVNIGIIPEGAGPIAGAIPLEEGESASTVRESLLSHILAALDRRLAQTRSEWRSDYLSHLHGLGETTSVRLPGSEARTLTPIGISEDGALEAVDESGQSFILSVGDVDLPTARQGERA